MKARRRAAARNLLRSPDATPKKKRHLVDGVWVDTLPSSARDAWLAEQADKARFKAEVEDWEAKEAESASLVRCRKTRLLGAQVPIEYIPTKGVTKQLGSRDQLALAYLHRFNDHNLRVMDVKEQLR